MNLVPNIDKTGQRMRMTGGVVAGLCGIALTVWGALAGSRTLLIIGIILIITGAFMIFEAAHGWCALRAMGMKTPR